MNSAVNRLMLTRLVRCRIQMPGFLLSLSSLCIIILLRNGSVYVCTTVDEHVIQAVQVRLG